MAYKKAIKDLTAFELARICAANGCKTCPLRIEDCRYNTCKTSYYLGIYGKEIVDVPEEEGK